MYWLTTGWISELIWELKWWFSAPCAFVSCSGRPVWEIFIRKKRQRRRKINNRPIIVQQRTQFSKSANSNWYFVYGKVMYIYKVWRLQTSWNTLSKDKQDKKKIREAGGSWSVVLSSLPWDPSIKSNAEWAYICSYNNTKEINNCRVLLRAESEVPLSWLDVCQRLGVPFLCYKP